MGRWLKGTKYEDPDHEELLDKLLGIATDALHAGEAHGGEGIPQSWCDAEKWRCVEGHVLHRSELEKTAKKGEPPFYVCYICEGRVGRTFPSDRTGPLAKIDIDAYLLDVKATHAKEIAKAKTTMSLGSMASGSVGVTGMGGSFSSGGYAGGTVRTSGAPSIGDFWPDEEEEEEFDGIPYTVSGDDPGA